MTPPAPLILLVEDNLDHAELVRRQLDQTLGPYRLIHAEDGEAALRLLQAAQTSRPTPNQDRPDLILLDLRLPRVDGLEVLRIAKNSPHLQPIPVIILTTSDGDQDIAAAQSHRADCYLTKPIDPQRLATLLHRVLPPPREPKTRPEPLSPSLPHPCSP